MFFAKPDEYEAAGLYSIEHLILFILTTICIIIAVIKTKDKKQKEVKKIIQNIAILE